MRPTCPVCGKLFWCDYPNLWRYKREKLFICSWSCLRKYDERREAKNMAYSKIRKDGTPAKKPGGKKKAEVPETIDQQVAVLAKEQETKKPRVPLTYDGYTVRCIEGVMGRFFYDKNYDRLDWTTPEGEEVSFSPAAWQKFATEELPNVMAILGVEL